MGPSAPHDAELVAESLAGRREAFGALFDRHARIVRAVVAGVSGDLAAVDDMTQESFLRAYRNLARLRDRQRFGAWVVGIARQVARERRRALRRDRHEFVNPQAWEIAHAATAEAKSQMRENFEQVVRALANLPEQERLAIHAFYLDEQSAPESAELMGLSRSGFYALLKRAVARLAAKCGAAKTGN